MKDSRSQPASLPGTRRVQKGARPFIKWAGGKQGILPQFEPLFPVSFDRYFEPFVGGGAVFFHLWNTGRLAGQVVLSDHNEELVNLYRVVRDHLDDLSRVLADHQRKHSKRYYYQVRELDRQPVELNDVERAARTVYLNRTCYNGLYRVNRKGQFNVPMGSYANPAILDEEKLQAASQALKNVVIETRNFRSLPEIARPGDFFYFDPPYDPVSETANFTSYTADNFLRSDQEDLAAVYTRLADMGCLCMLSNARTPFILQLYQRFRVETVTARRLVNSKPAGRGAIKEVVVLNY